MYDDAIGMLSIHHTGEIKQDIIVAFGTSAGFKRGATCKKLSEYVIFNSKAQRINIPYIPTCAWMTAKSK